MNGLDLNLNADLMKLSPALMMPALIAHNNLIQKAKFQVINAFIYLPSYTCSSSVMAQPGLPSIVKRMYPFSAELWLHGGAGGRFVLHHVSGGSGRSQVLPPGTGLIYEAHSEERAHWSLKQGLRSMPYTVLGTPLEI